MFKLAPYSYTKIEECLICLCDVQKNQYKSYCKNCRTFYHKACLDKWWNKNEDVIKKCPHCQFSKNSIYRDCCVFCCFQ